jgi:predicted DNA-binding protein
VTKRRIPTISNDRIDISVSTPQIATSKEERHAHSFMKGREPIQITSLRLPESRWEKLKLLSFGTGESLNNLILKAIELYIEQDEVKKQIARAKRRQADI